MKIYFPNQIKPTKWGFFPPRFFTFHFPAPLPSLPWHHAQLTFKRTLARWYTQWSENLIKPISSFWSKFCKMSRWQWNYSWIPIAIPSGTGLKDWQSSYPRIWMQLQNGFQPSCAINITELWMLWMVPYILCTTQSMYYM